MFFGLNFIKWIFDLYNEVFIMKIITFYLPQFHSIPENDKWWGDGFTEWTNVKKAKPLFEGHDQPKVPLNNNYYNLLDDDVKIWQAKLAKKYGIYGFCYYHYWFNGKMLLEKPMEQMLVNKKVDIPFCISWCNEPWTSIWVGNARKVLISQHYGGEKDWIEHYNYLSKFFKDNRYIFIDGKPVLVIYRPEVIPQINNMLEVFNKCAKADGFSGLTFISYLKNYNYINNSHYKFDYVIDSLLSFYAIGNKYNNICISELFNKLISFTNEQYEKIFGYGLNSSIIWRVLKKIYNICRLDKQNKKSIIYDEYENILKYVLSFSPTTDKSIPAYFVNWDNTPRYGINGKVIDKVSPEIFKKYFKEFVIKTKKEYKSDLMFFSAWNEWAEGSILEPDEKFKYSFLESIKEVLLELNEFPNY